MTRVLFLFVALFLLLAFALSQFFAPRASAQVTGHDCTVSAADLMAGAEEYQLLDSLNAYRAEHGAGPLALSASLTRAAAWWGRDAATYGLGGHVDHFGRHSWDRMADCGFPNPTSVWMGENSAQSSSYATAAQVFQGWKGSSQGHNETMLDRVYVAAGIKLLVEPNSVGGYYWVLDLTSRLDSPYVPPGTTPSTTPTRTVTPTRTTTATRTETPTRGAPTLPPTWTPTPTRVLSATATVAAPTATLPPGVSPTVTLQAPATALPGPPLPDNWMTPKPHWPTAIPRASWTPKATYTPDPRRL